MEQNNSQREELLANNIRSPGEAARRPMWLTQREPGQEGRGLGKARQGPYQAGVCRFFIRTVISTLIPKGVCGKGTLDLLSLLANAGPFLDP